MPGVIDPTELHVWRVPLGLAIATGWKEILSPAEQRRAARFVFSRDRDRYISGHLALRSILASVVGGPPGSIQLRYGPQGKPRLAGAEVEFSLSYARAQCLLVIATGTAVGVDLEEVRPIDACSEMALRFFTPSEARSVCAAPAAARSAAFLRCWTGKEAVLKATSRGLTHAMNTFEVGAEPDGFAVRPTSADRELEGWRVSPIRAGPRHVAAVCWLGGPRRIVYRRWDPGLAATARR